MAEDIVINGTTYNGVNVLALKNKDGRTVSFYPDAIRYTAQTLTDEQKEQARENIGIDEAFKSGIVADVIEEGALPYIAGNGTTEGVWTGTSDKITAYSEGLTILYKINVAGVSGGSTLNINGLGAIPVKRNASTAVTTTYPVGSIVMLTYSGGVWLTADYDANTKTTAGTSNKVDAKMYLVGGTSQSSSGVTTYSNKNVYIGTDNRLYSNDVVVPTIDEVVSATKSRITLGLHTDGLVYLFVDGLPVGSGVAIVASGGDVVGNVDSANNIVLTGTLPVGTYTFKYVNEDGTETVIGTHEIIDGEPDEPTIIPIVWLEGQKCDYTVGSKCNVTTNASYCISEKIEVETGAVYTVTVATTSTTELRIVGVNNDDIVTEGSEKFNIVSGTNTFTFTPSEGTTHMRLRTYKGMSQFEWTLVKSV